MKNKKQEEYNKVDKLVVLYFKELFHFEDINDNKILNFLVAPENAGGLDMMLPGKYYPLMT